MQPVIEQLNPHACKTYLITAAGCTDAVLIDPVIDHVDRYRRLLSERNLSLTTAIDTHTHADHISGAASLTDDPGCVYLMHRNAPAPCVGTRVEDGYEWEILPGVPARALYTPGHTRDSLSVLVAGALFTGDALFLDDGGAGRDDLPGGDAGAHWESLEKIKRLPDDIIIYPAHDYRERKPSALSRQKAGNPHMKERSKEEFILYLEDLQLGPADWMKDVLKANFTCTRDPHAAWIPTDSPACEVKGTLDPALAGIEVAEITTAELRTLLASGPAPVLLDVREPQELTEELGHMEGVINIPIGALAARTGEIPAGRMVISICRSGSRARTAAQILSKAGFTDVKVLAGGMKAWRQNG